MAKVKTNNNESVFNLYLKELKKFKYLLLVISFVLYGNSIFNKYALDDDLVVTENKLVQGGFKNLGKIFVSHYSNKGNQSYDYRPLVIASFAIEHQIFGSNPHISHFISILLYWLVMFQLFLFLRNLLGQYHQLVPATIVLIFAFLPVHSEVVDNIKCRDELLSLLFMLLAGNFIIKYFEENNIVKLLFALLLAFLALLSKLSTLPLVLLIPFLIWYFKSDIKIKKIATVFVIIAISYGLLVLIKKSIFEVPSARDFKYFENPLYILKYNLIQKVPVLFYSMGYYIKLFFLPYPLLYYYGYSHVSIPGYDNIWMYITLAVILFFVYLAFKNFKSKPIWVAGIVFFMVAIFPFTNFLSPAPGIIAERFLFTASLGLCIAIVPLIVKIDKEEFIGNRKNILLIWMVISTFIIISRNTDWKDASTLYNADIDHLENSAKAHSLLAVTNVSEIDKSKVMQEKVFHANEAVKHFKRAIEIYPEYTICINNLGSVYFNYFNDYTNAKPLFIKAIKQDPDYFEAYFNLASTYEKLNQNDSSIIIFKKLANINPDHQKGLINLTRLLVNESRFEEAISFNKEIVSKYPDKITSYVNLANIYLVKKDSLMAIPFLEKANQIDPSNTQIQGYLSVLRQMQNKNAK